MKGSIMAYLDCLWMQQNCSSWVRLYIGHDKSFDLFKMQCLKDWVLTHNYHFYRETIQAKYISKCGFLMGYHTDSFNTVNLQEALS